MLHLGSLLDVGGPVCDCAIAAPATPDLERWTVAATCPPHWDPPTSREALRIVK